MENLLIGAISGNYNIEDVKYWTETSNFKNVKRVLLLYNNTNQILVNYLKQNNIDIIVPNFDFWGNEIEIFETNTGNCNIETSYNLIHNIRFLHIWKYLEDNKYKKVLVTDVRDVYFNRDPFIQISSGGLTATSEVIKYEEEAWNKEHILSNVGILSIELLLNEVYNVGVFGGNYEVVKNICKDIYLISVGKPKVADQTSFNYLIHNSYKHLTAFTNLAHKLAVHLHVVNSGQVPFDITKINEYSIIHQYDRIPGFLLNHYPLQK